MRAGKCGDRESRLGPIQPWAEQIHEKKKPMSSAADLFYKTRGFLTKLTCGKIGTKPDSRRCGDWFDAYLSERFIPGGRFEGGAVERLDLGLSTETRIITGPSGEAAIARCFPRRRRREKGPEFVHISTLLSGLGVDIPALVFNDSSNLTLGRYGFDVVVEEWVDGRPPTRADFTADDSVLLERLAAMLANMHDETSGRIGRPWLKYNPKKNYLKEYYEDREAWALRNIERSDLIPSSEGELREIRGFFDRHRGAIYEGGPYSLVHGDVHPLNLIVTGDERRPLVLIDIGTVRYDLWPWDFVPLHIAVFEEDLSLTKKLLALYREKRGLRDLDYFHHAWPYLYVWFHVRSAGASVRKYGRNLKGKKTRSSLELSERKIREGYQKALEGVRSPLF